MQIYEGTVKRLYIEKMPSERVFGIGLFEFTSDFSIFDYGKMPQSIPDKGEALKRESVHWFIRLEEEGIRTHFIEDIDERRMRIKVARKLGYDEIDDDTRNYMIPLEIIFRNNVLPSSSLHRRLREGKIDPERYGLRIPKPDETIDLNRPIIEFSTKIEEIDEYLTDDEKIANLAGLRSDEIDLIGEMALTVNEIITKEVKRLNHIDGKVEMAMGPEREIYVCDTIGTSDENRFLYKGLDLSKQMIRDYYKSVGWYEELMKAREKKMTPPRPPLIDEELLHLINQAYRALCVEITGEEWEGTLSIDEVTHEYEEWMDRKRGG
jgi:phosphoribosylaminoimidazole-succinocarboxamide synthase